VYFDVTSFDEYGKLSNQQVDEIEAGAEPDEQSEKRNPADFALWKANGVDPAAIEGHRHGGAAPAEEACETAQTWESPWGGAPGLAHRVLGDEHDAPRRVHRRPRRRAGPGLPHHENEDRPERGRLGRAVREVLAPRPPAGDERREDVLVAGELLHHPDRRRGSNGADVVRTFLLSTAYHNRAVYSEETIAEATERWETLERGTSGPSRPVTTSTPTPPRATSPCARPSPRSGGEFERAMNDDFNTREALAALTELVGAVNVHVDGAETFDYQGLRAAIETLEEFGGDVLGLSFGDESTDGDVAVAEDLVELVLDLREREREAGNYERADELRDEVEALGVEVQDTDDGPTYRIE